MMEQIINQNRVGDVDFIPIEGNFFVSGQMAQEWLDLFEYKHQRRVREYHIDYLSELMEEGSFTEKTQIAFCKWGDWFYLVNGYHTLNAIIKTKKEILLNIVVHNVSSGKEIAAIYSRYDNHLKRTVGDSLSAFELAEQAGVTQTQIGKFSPGAVYVEFMKGRLGTNVRAANILPIEKKVYITEKYLRYAKNVFIATGDAGKKPFMRRRSTIAAMILCAEFQNQKLNEFWLEMVRDDGLLKGDPRKTLLNWLQETIIQASMSGAGRTQKKMKGEHEFVKAIAACWNAFYDRRSLKLIKYNYLSKEVTFKGIGNFIV